MTDPFYFKSGQASLWAQPDGANTEAQYLGCHEIADVEESDGDLSPLFCPDPAKVGGFVIRDTVRGAPDLPSTEIVVPVGKTLDYMEEWDCPGNIIVLKSVQGRRDLFTNWQRAHLLHRVQRTGRTYGPMAARTPDADEESMVTVPLSFLQQSILVRLHGVRQTIAGIEDLLVAAFVDDPQCQNGGPRVRRGQIGLVAGRSDVAAEADLYFTEDGGETWTVTAADPFAVAEDIGAAVYLPWEPGTNRAIVARSTTDGANAAEIAYSDDDGATWTAVDVGSTVGQFITTMFALDRYHIWAGTDDGYIYFSSDGGATWTAQEEGVIHAADYLDIHFLDARYGVAVGEANIVAETTNGGRTWTAVTGPAVGDNLTTVQMVTQNRWFIGTNAGELYSTENGGDDWEERTFSGSGAGEVQTVRFENELVGMMIHDTATPEGRFFRTKDGGYTWEQEPIPDNDGLTDLVPVGVNAAMIVGLTSGATGFVAEVVSV